MNKIAILIFLILPTTTSFSQKSLVVRNKEFNVEAGFYTGPTFYTMYGGEVDLRTRRGATLNERIDLGAGFETRFNFYKYFYASFGLSYLRKGGHLEGGGWVYQSPVEVNYLMIPITFGLSSPRSFPLSVSVEGGWAGNFLLSARNNYSKDIVSGYYVKENKNIGSVHYGFEVSYNAFKKIIPFLSYRSTKDLNFFHARKNDFTGENYDLWNKGYAVSFGIRLKGASVQRALKEVKDSAPAEAATESTESVRKKSFSWGAKLGFNLNNTVYKQLPDETEDDSRSQLNTHLGLYFSFRLGKALAFINEIQYIRKGYNFDSNGNNRMRLILEYIELPFLLSYKISEPLSIEAGPAVGLFIDGKSKGDGTTQRDWYYADIIEYGVNGGLRFNVTETLSASFRYYQGLNNISSLYEVENSYSGKNTGEFNQNFQLSVYLKL